MSWIPNGMGITGWFPILFLTAFVFRDEQSFIVTIMFFKAGFIRLFYLKDFPPFLPSVGQFSLVILTFFGIIVSNESKWNKLQLLSCGM
jgi:hypothetical protein